MEVMGYYMLPGAWIRMPADVVKSHGLPHPATQEETNGSTMGGCCKYRHGGPSPCLKSQFLALFLWLSFALTPPEELMSRCSESPRKPLNFSTIPPAQLKLLTKLMVTTDLSWRSSFSCVDCFYLVLRNSLAFWDIHSFAFLPSVGCVFCQQPVIFSLA